MAILDCSEPSWTDLKEDIVQAMWENSAPRTGEYVGANLRAGLSDARSWRHVGVPNVVYGVTPNTIGRADEYATVEDLKTALAAHTPARMTT